MTTTTSNIKKVPKIPAKSIALPVEHGAWGFLFEPLIAGLIVAPSAGAPFIALMVVGAFLLRQPLKFLLGDWLQGRRLPRTRLAVRFSLIFGGVTLLGLLGAFFFAPLVSFVPFLAAAPAAVYLIYQDAARQSRQLLPELLAAAALASSASALALADGWSYLSAAGLWALMLARLIPSVLYVRSRLRLEKGKDFSRLSPLATHALALGGAAGAGVYFSNAGLILPILMLAFLLFRAIVGLSDYRTRQSAKALGVREVVYGVLYATAVIVGSSLGA